MSQEAVLCHRCFGLGDGCAQSIFKRAAAGRSDPDAASLDRLAIGLADRVLYCCEPGVHKVSQRAACEAMREHNCMGGAERNAGEQSQRPPLFRAHMTFSRRRCHHLVVAKVASRATAQLLLRFAAPARARFNALT